MTTKDGVQDVLDAEGLQLDKNGRIGWRDNAKQHPRNWTWFDKTYTVLVVTWLEFFMTAISAAGASTAEAAMKEYGISSTLAYFAFLTMYLLGQTLGAIFCSPVSEVFGRRTIYTIGTALFCASSIVVAAPTSSIAVYFGRFFQGVAAAIPATVAFGNFSDMYDANHRIWVVYIYTVVGISGLTLGPIYGTYITAVLGWRWAYYISTIVAFASIVGCLFIKESNAKQIVEVKVKKIREHIGEDLRADTSDEHVTVKSFMTNNLGRPVEFLIREPIVFFCAALCATAFALIYGLTESLTIVYTSPPFSETFNETNSSLSFVAILIGQMLDILPRFYDAALLATYRKTKRRITPETKIYSLVTSAPALAIGLWIFAWTIPPLVTSVPWPVSMIGLILVGYATNDLSYILFGYATDAYGFHAASAVSAVSLTRTLAAAVLPLFTTQMYEGMGNNKATTVFAAIATAFCITPWLFLRYGARLRKISKFAASGDDILADENQHMQDVDGARSNESHSHHRSDSGLLTFVNDVEKAEKTQSPLSSGEVIGVDGAPAQGDRSAGTLPLPESAQHHSEHTWLAGIHKEIYQQE